MWGEQAITTTIYQIIMLYRNSCPLRSYGWIRLGSKGLENLWAAIKSKKITFPEWRTVAGRHI